ncbi:MAG: MFS transporter [Pseudomonadota bacterium]
MSALLLAYLAFVAIGLPDGALGIAWPSLRDGFALPQSGLALILVAQTAGYLLAGTASARLLGRLAIGDLLARSTAVVALAAVAFALAPATAVLPLAGFVLGLGSATIDAGLNAHAAAHFSARHLNWLHAAYGIGAALGPVILTGTLAASGDWRLGYAVLAALLFALAILFHARRTAFAATAPVRGGATVEGLAAVPHDGRRLAALQVLAFAIYTGIEASLGSWSFAVLREARGLPLEVAGAGAAAFWASLCLGRFLVGFVADRAGSALLIRGGAALTLLGTTLFLLLPGPLAIGGLALAGLALAPIFPMLMLRTAERFAPELAARLFGLQVSAAMVGALVLPSLAGILADLVALAAIPWLIAAASAVLLLLVLPITRPPPAFSPTAGPPPRGPA